MERMNAGHHPSRDSMAAFTNSAAVDMKQISFEEYLSMGYTGSGDSDSIGYGFIPRPLDQVTPYYTYSSVATLHARSVYVGGLPPTANEETVTIYFNEAMAAIGGSTAGPGDPVLKVKMNQEKKFAFVEMRSVEEASNAMALNDITFNGARLKVRRPADYIPTPFLGPIQPSPRLNLAAVGLKCRLVQGFGPDCLFVGNLPRHLTSAQVKELLELVAPLQAFYLVRDRETQESKGYASCLYQNLTAVDLACVLLNGKKMGDSTLTARRIIHAGTSQAMSLHELKMRQAPIQRQMEILTLESMFQGSGPQELPTKVVCVTQAVSEDQLRDDEVYDGIVANMLGEGREYGNLMRVVIPRPDTYGAPVAGVGKVFLQYADIYSSCAAKTWIGWKKLGGKRVTAGFYSENKFTKGEYDG